MSFDIISIAYIVIIVLFTISGIKRGLFKSLVSLIKNGLTFILSIILAKPLALIFSRSQFGLKISRKFTELFTQDKPILANFHGYPETLENILENYTERRRLRVHGFNEEGSTTTPFEMLRRNMASRYDLAIDIARVKGRRDLAAKYEKILTENHLHATKYGEDLIK